MTQNKLEIAFDLHRLGRLGEAKRLYKEILETSPGHFDVLHLLGLATYQDGGLQEAEACFVQALEIKSDFWQIYVSYGRTLHDMGRLEEARVCYDEAIRLNPADAEAWCEQALVMKDLKRPAEALQSLQRAIDLLPTYAMAFNNRGAVLRDLDRLEEALASYDDAITRDGSYALAFSNRGVVLKDLGRLDDALASFDQSLRMTPLHADAHFNRGNTLKEMSRWAEALASYDEALLINPKHAEAFCNRGNTLHDLDRFDAAIASYDQAIAIHPAYAQAYSNRGEALKSLGRLEEATTNYDAAITLAPDDAEPLWNKGLVKLLQGDLKLGWELYEWRKRTKEAHGARSFPKPLWNGREGLAGKTILVHWEQGLGDTIQFSRYVTQFDQLGARVLFAPQKPLRALMKRLAGSPELVDADAPGFEFDYHVPLLSAPYAFGTDFSNIPCLHPYLSADANRIAFWGNKIGAEGFRIGVCWQGSTGRIDKGRSFPIALLASLSKLPGVRLISLHRGDGESQLRDLPAGMRVETLGRGYDAGPDAFMDAAAAISCCNLVISSDTAIAHLAGALGATTWVALKHLPDWRWLRDRDDCPWYPGLRLFRQPSPGDWTAVFHEMEVMLEGAMTSLRRRTP